MHESGIIIGLLRQITEVAQKHHARRIRRVSVRLGALSNMTPMHFREHFGWAATGTIAEGARLDIDTGDDFTAADAHDVVITSVDVDD